MIIGVGTDLVEIGRIEQIIRRRGDRFLKMVFTAREIAYCEQKRIPAIHYAARFAAKESFFKSVGRGLGMGLSLREIEVTRNDRGKPEIHLYGGAKRIFDEKGGMVIHISLTHTRAHASAVVVVEA